MTHVQEARNHYRGAWPAELTSGVMFWKGTRITRDEFTRAPLTSPVAPPPPAEQAAWTVENAPLGTLAPAFMGGHWCRVESGWKWNGPDGSGGVFPRPGGDWTGTFKAPAEQASGELPELPKYQHSVWVMLRDENREMPAAKMYFTAEQMRAYARAALSQRPVE